MPIPASIQMGTDRPHSHGFWSAVRDVVRCNRKDGKRWQCAREVVPGQKYCERHVGRGRNRPKRSAEGYSATSEVPATPSLGAISSVSMAVAAHAAASEAAYGDSQLSPILQQSPMISESGRACLPRGFEKIARVKSLYDKVRSNFPYFDAVVGKSYPTFMENAGGSQCPRVVIDAISNYMKTSYAQLGAGHEVSNRADEVVKTAHEHMKTFTNAHGSGEVVFGPSTSQLITTLSNSYGYVLREGDEVIVHEANHEANVAPWIRMAARRGVSVKWWRVNYDTFESNLNDLAHLLSPRTRIVAVPHVSNLLGEILDLGRLVKLVKSRIYEVPVRVIVDGVAFAPHRSVDVDKWGVDWYVFSSYKVYGPHMAVLVGAQDAFMDIKDEGPNWDFVDSDDVVKKFEVGSICHEACAGVVALTHYLGVLARIGGSFSLPLEGKQRLQLAASNQTGNGSFSVDERVENTPLTYLPCGDDPLKSLTGTGTLDLQPLPESVVENIIPSLRDWEFALQGTSFGQDVTGAGGTVSTHLDRVVVEAAYDTVLLLEQPLQEKLLAFLSLRNDVVIIGPKSPAVELRVPTVSFIHVSKNSADICRALQAAGFAVRNGHMYCYRLVSGLLAHNKLTVNSVEDGVVRISMVHYNTPIEVTRLIVCLQSIL